jgi:hypothetical protein
MPAFASPAELPQPTVAERDIEGRPHSLSSAQRPSPSPAFTPGLRNEHGRGVPTVFSRLERAIRASN